jgi:hypothetical protein
MNNDIITPQYTIRLADNELKFNTPHIEIIKPQSGCGFQQTLGAEAHIPLDGASVGPIMVPPARKSPASSERDVKGEKVSGGFPMVRRHAERFGAIVVRRYP